MLEKQAEVWGKIKEIIIWLPTTNCVDNGEGMEVVMICLIINIICWKKTKKTKSPLTSIQIHPLDSDTYLEKENIFSQYLWNVEHW